MVCVKAYRELEQAYATAKLTLVPPRNPKPQRTPKAVLRGEIDVMVGQIGEREGLGKAALNRQLLRMGFPNQLSARRRELLRLRAYLADRAQQPVAESRGAGPRPEDVARYLRALPPDVLGDAIQLLLSDRRAS